jgi:Immunity protein Imm5
MKVMGGRVRDRRALDEAQAHIRDIDTAGELPLTVRRKLKEDLIAVLPSGRHALAFVATLGLTCAKYAWPVWRTKFPSESGPMDLAEAAVSSARGESASGAWTQRQLMRLRAHLESKLLLGQDYFPAVYAGFASWAVTRDVLSWGYPRAAQRGTEAEISPDEWDPCFLASMAITGGATWEGTGRSDTRREFWSWYLTAAVPEAFMAAVGNLQDERDNPEPGSQEPLF